MIIRETLSQFATQGTRNWPANTGADNAAGSVAESERELSSWNASVVVDNCMCPVFQCIAMSAGMSLTVGLILRACLLVLCFSVRDRDASVRGYFSKVHKGWNKRSGTDRHLICIEDPFDTSHDLGRVVDKDSIGVLRSEFERAAKILATEEDPLPLLFEKYIPVDDGKPKQQKDVKKSVKKKSEFGTQPNAFDNADILHDLDAFPALSL